MTRLGFLLDSDSCIGCHACTVACKSEHDVPLGVNRTWIKYVETGTFPNTARHFSVMRCNQCADAPCMTICPTSALFRADNGVVDFDTGNCIGCKACMNACPYDAIFINPETNTANKCNFCNHRVEVGLEPSCVIVCPTQAIVVADLDDPTNPATRIIARDDVAVRSPEQNTKPAVFYRGADQSSLDPTRTIIRPDGMIWADTTARHPTVGAADAGVVARTAYTTPHEPTWGTKVAGYLVTKAVAGGTMLLAALLVLLGHAEVRGVVGIIPPLVSALFLVATAVLLVADLKQPARFHYLFTRPNWSSWLVKGSWVLVAFGAVLTVWFVAGLADNEATLEGLALPAALLGAFTAGYSAFLFAQCEGRDLWQTPLLLPLFVARAAVAGAAAFLVVDVFAEVPSAEAVRWVLLGAAAAVAFFSLVEVGAHGSRHVELAVRSLTRGPEASLFWGGLGFGAALPIVVVGVDRAVDATTPMWGALAAVSAIVGMFLSELAMLRAGQSVPLS